MLPFLVPVLVIHILYTECAKIKKKKSGAKGITLHEVLLHSFKRKFSRADR